MLEKWIKPTYQKLLIDPYLERCSELATPNTLTLSSLICGLMFLPLLLLNCPLLAILMLLISGYLDSLDGALARQQNHSTSLGAAFDIMADRVVEFTVILALYLAYPGHSLICILMLGSILVCITSFLVVGIFTANTSAKSFHYSQGLMERPEAFIFFILMTMFSGYINFLGGLFTILVIYTAVIRLLEFKQACEQGISETSE